MSQSQNNTLAFTDDTFSMLRALALHENMSVEQLLAKAIKTEKFLQEQRDSDRKVLLETPEGKLLRVVF